MGTARKAGSLMVRVMPQFPLPWRRPPFGSRRYRLRRWLSGLRPMTRREHDRRLARERQAISAAATKAVGEAQAVLDERIRSLLPRLTAAAIARDRDGYLRLEVMVSERVVDSMHGYPGDLESAFRYITEQLAFELRRQLLSLDFATVVRATPRRPVSLLPDPPTWLGWTDR